MVGLARQKYVVVEGVIGVGKTTLVHNLAEQLSGRLVLEEFEDNPFLADFYKDKAAYALSTQLFFLMSRFRQQEVLAQGELFQNYTISDYLFDKDRIFALLTLEKHELSLYEQLFEVLRPQTPRPDLVIYLKADHETIMQRIATRGRDYERDMDPGYNKALAQAYGRYFTEYDACPVLTIDTTHVDFRGPSPALTRVLQAVDELQSSAFMSAESLGLVDPNPALPGFD